MRKLVVLVFVFVVIAGVLSVVDIVVREGVQEAIASRIEARSPGSDAVVKISSFPFLGHLAASGTVPSMEADVTDVQSGGLRFTHIDLHFDDLEVDRSRLTHGDIEARSIKSGTVVADLGEDSVASLAHVPLSLGQGTVGVDGTSVRVQLRVVHDAIVVDLGHALPSFKVAVPELDILPCVDTVKVVPDALQLSCHFSSLPGLMAHTTFHI